MQDQVPLEVRLSGLAVMAVVRVVDHQRTPSRLEESAPALNRPVDTGRCRSQYVAGSAACGHQQEHQDRPVRTVAVLIFVLLRFDLSYLAEDKLILLDSGRHNLGLHHLAQVNT